MNRLGVEALSFLGMPPVEYVKMVAELGCIHMSTGLTGFPPSMNPENYPAWSLRDDAALRREMIAAMRDTGVFISLGEGLLVRPGTDARQNAHDLDVFAELGVRYVNNVSMDPDLSRTLDEIEIQVEMIEERGMASVIEFFPYSTIADMPSALAVIDHVGKPNFGLLIDTMHLIRSGSTPADLAAVNPSLIGYAQLCDSNLAPVTPDYVREASFERKDPGSGELPLVEILRALPRETLLGLEVPKFADAKAGIGPRERIGPCVEASRRLLAEAG